MPVPPSSAPDGAVEEGPGTPAGRTAQPPADPTTRTPGTDDVRDVPPPVDVLDTPTTRVHHPGDLLALVATALGAVLVVVLATYAQNTTTGVAEDVQGFADLLRRILFVPVSFLEAFTTIVVPIAVLTELAVRRLGRQLLEGLIAAAAAILVTTAVHWVVQTLGSPHVQVGLSVRLGGAWVLTIPSYMAMLAALLTLSGPRSRRRSVAWSWNLLWVTIGVLLITAQVSLPGVALALLLGRTVGLAVRYASGVTTERAEGDALVLGVRRAGLVPARIHRVQDPAPGAEPPLGSAALPTPSPARLALARSSGDRLYALTTADGRELDLLAFDGDRQVVGMLTRLWRSLRLRGIEGRSALSLRQATERAALLAYAAAAAGVRTPQLLRIAEVDDSLLLVQERPGDAVPVSELDDLDDRELDEIWSQLRRAHAAGLAHRALTSDVVLVERTPAGPQVWITGWELGDVASSELARRLDVTQLVALLALRVGASRTVASAARALTEAELAGVGPLLQTVTLPRRTRDELRAHRDVLADLRTVLIERLPAADLEPVQVVRFGARTIFTIFVTVVAVFIILASVNVATITEVLAESDWRYSALSFAFGLVTLLGAALAFVAFSPVRLPVWRATLVQTAATFVALAAPAGIGPAALNLRMLTRRGVSSSLAAATVALVQVSQFVVTLLLLLVLTLTSGVGSNDPFTVPPAALVALAVVALLVGASLLFPQVRAWVTAKVGPTVRQTLPRLIEVLGQPWRLALAVGGNVLMTMGYVLAFDAALAALGQSASLVQVALVYLAGNAGGALIPTPGGIGTVETALALGLTTAAGVNAGVAGTVAILFRVMTFWLRIPFGWVAMRYLQRVGEL